MFAADALREIAKEEGWNQSEIARELGITRQMVNYCMKENRMSLDTFIGICNAMGYEVAIFKGLKSIPIEMGMKGIERLPMVKGER